MLGILWQYINYSTECNSSSELCRKREHEIVMWEYYRNDAEREKKKIFIPAATCTTYFTNIEFDAFLFFYLCDKN